MTYLFVGLLVGCFTTHDSARANDTKGIDSGTRTGPCTSLIGGEQFGHDYTPAFCAWAVPCGVVFASEEECTAFYNDDLQYWDACFDDAGLATCLQTIQAAGAACDESTVDGIVAACTCTCRG